MQDEKHKNQADLTVKPTESDAHTDDNVVDDIADDVGVDALADLQEKQAQLEAENAKLNDRLMRALADMENMRRRSEKEKQEAARYGVAPLGRELFVVADNLRRALDSLPVDMGDKDDTVKNLVIGVEMTEKQLQEAFIKCGIEKVPGLGEKFDYKIHQAVSEMANTGQPAGTIIEELQGGYRLHERLLRPAMVIVAKGEATPEVETSENINNVSDIGAELDTQNVADNPKKSGNKKPPHIDTTA